MASPAINLFHRLHKWASRQDENFLTESLAVVLENLLILAPAVGVRLVSKLTGGFIDLPGEDAGAIGIKTQVELVTGRPDLEIQSPYRLAWVEVKVEAGLRTGQLDGYRVLLGESGFEHTKLVLLTRYPESFRSSDTRPDVDIRWYEVAEWLEQEILSAESAGTVAGFLIRQFHEFLEVRSMTLTQVGKFMPEGLRALSSLMNMLYEASVACKLTVKKKGGWDYMGLDLDGGKYRVAVDYSEPEKLWFGTKAKIETKAATELGTGEPTSAWKQGFFSWWRGIELDSESVHFYARSKVSQMQWLEGFIRESLEMAKSIETRDQPAIPEESEDDQ
jgi:hypothetical protein